MPTTYTNDTKVKDLLGDNYNGKSSLQAFIGFAHGILGRMITCASAKGTPLTDTEKTTIAGLLAAHAYLAQDALYTSRSTLRASGSWQRKTGDGLEGTEYGRLALLADPSGCLSAISKKQTAGCAWGGSEINEQTTWDERN